MATTPEGRVKGDIKKWLDAHGFWRAGTKKPHADIVGWYYMPVSNGMGVHGIPDFPLVYKGRAIYIEAKAPKGQPTENQKDRHAEIRAAGGEVYVVDDVTQLEGIFHGR